MSDFVEIRVCMLMRDKLQRIIPQQDPRAFGPPLSTASTVYGMSFTDWFGNHISQTAKQIFCFFLFFSFPAFYVLKKLKR